MRSIKEGGKVTIPCIQVNAREHKGGPVLTNPVRGWKDTVKDYN